MGEMTTAINPREAKKVYCRDCKLYKSLTVGRFILTMGWAKEKCLHPSAIEGNYHAPDTHEILPSKRNSKNTCRWFKYK